jgi:hypothetical protein
MPADEVAEPQPRAALRQPLSGAMAVGTEGEHQRRLQHHGLVEVQFAQALLAFDVDGLDDRHHVQVAAGRRPLQGLDQHPVHQRRVDALVLEGAYRAVGRHQAGERVGGHGGPCQWQCRR